MPAHCFILRSAVRLSLIGVTAWAVLSVACIGPFAPTTGASRQGASIGTPTAQFASIAAGAPITVTAATPRLPAPADGAALAPVAAYGSELLLAVSPPTAGGAPSPSSGSTPSSYELWNPATGAVTPVPSLDTPSGQTERVLGSWQDWILIARSAGAQASSGSLQLRDLKTDEVRELTTDADTARGGGSQISGDGHVAWVTGSTGSASLHMYDIASGATSTIPNRFALSRRFSLQAGHLASLGGSSGQVVVRDLATRSSQAVSVGNVLSLALSSDGRSLIWIERAGNDASRLLVRDLASGVTVQVLSGAAVGFGLSVSGPYVSWQPRPGAPTSAAGVYNVQTRELRLVQTAPSVTPYLASVMGGWFVWTQATGQALSGAGAVRTAGSSSAGSGLNLYLAKLGP
jgi:hypothetical protein